MCHLWGNGRFECSVDGVREKDTLVNWVKNEEKKQIDMYSTAR